MAFKYNIVVEQDPSTYNYTVRYTSPEYSFVKKAISYDDAMLILGALEQGREEAKEEIRKALGVD